MGAAAAATGGLVAGLVARTLVSEPFGAGVFGLVYVVLILALDRTDLFARAIRRSLP